MHSNNKLKENKIKINIDLAILPSHNISSTIKTIEIIEKLTEIGPNKVCNS